LKAVILAGGFATRLRPLSCTRPKILFPIANKPLLQWTFERLVKSNVQDVIMAVSYRTEILFKQYRIPRCGLHIIYSRDPLRKPLGTGGPIKRAEKLIGHEEPFLVLNEDVFAQMDYAEIIKAHEKHDAVATIALHEVKNPSRYGVAELGKNNSIKRFVEKPKSGTAPTNLINAGVYVLSPRIFKYIPEGRAVSIEREVFPTLAKESLLFGHVFGGLWTDIGKPEDYLAINREMLRRIRPRHFKLPSNAEIHEPVAIDKKVVLGENASIGPYAVLGMNVSIGKNTRIRNSVVFPHTKISDTCTIEGAIIGENVKIGKAVKIGRGCIIADQAKIKDNRSLTERVSVCPASEVSKNVLTSNRNC
jgi:mannose-1-phosphate guanylyltransferase